MPSQPSEEKKKKRSSSGITAVMDARLLAALETKARAEVEHRAKKHKPTGMRAVVGWSLIGIWTLFLVAEFFHLVEHENNLGHIALQWSPLVVGLALVAPDVIDKVKELAMWVVGILAKIRKIKVSLPEEKEGE